MNIQENEYYICRNGELAGPMDISTPVNAESGSPWASFRGLYREDGTFGYSDLRYPPFDILDTVDNAARKHVEGA